MNTPISTIFLPTAAILRKHEELVIERKKEMLEKRKQQIEQKEQELRVREARVFEVERGKTVTKSGTGLKPSGKRQKQKM